jgi:hypothetical protein
MVTSLLFSLFLRQAMTIAIGTPIYYVFFFFSNEHDMKICSCSFEDMIYSSVVDHQYQAAHWGLI